MTIYIDNDYKCHVTDDGTRRAFDVPFFDGKCAEFIEGYRYVPSGETWTRADGQTFRGEMIAPCRDYSQILEIQTAVDRIAAEKDAEIAEINEAMMDFVAMVEETEEV